MTQSHDQAPEPGQPQAAGPTERAQPQSYDQVATQAPVEQPRSAVPGFHAPTAPPHNEPTHNEPTHNEPTQAGYVYQVQPTHTYDQPAPQPYPAPYGQPAPQPYPTAYGQPPAGQPYPAPYGYPAAPLPLAPVAYGHYRRPGVVTASAVLAHVQAGITGIATLFMFVSLFDSGFGTGRLLVQTAAVLAAAAGVGLLIGGGVKIASGSDRTMLQVACVLQFAICLFYLIVFATLPDEALDPDNTAEFEGELGAARGGLIFFAIFFAIMPTISLALSRSQSATDFLRSRHG